MQELDQHVWKIIFEKINIDDLARVARVSQFFFGMTQHNEFWQRALQLFHFQEHAESLPQTWTAKKKFFYFAQIDFQNLSSEEKKIFHDFIKGNYKNILELFENKNEQEVVQRNATVKVVHALSKKVIPLVIRMAFVNKNPGNMNALITTGECEQPHEAHVESREIDLTKITHFLIMTDGFARTLFS